jgi:ligand-binding SRPBCC domain-containing protein
MPIFESVVSFAAPPATVFALLRRPSVLVQLAPPELHLRVESGPDELEIGSRLVMCGRRWGVPQLVLEHRQGPFRRWTHEQRLEVPPEGGTCLSERVEYEPPGGLLGLTVTAAFLERELSSLFAFRRQKLAELLGG